LTVTPKARLITLRVVKRPTVATRPLPVRIALFDPSARHSSCQRAPLARETTSIGISNALDASRLLDDDVTLVLSRNRSGPPLIDGGTRRQSSERSSCPENRDVRVCASREAQCRVLTFRLAPRPLARAYRYRP